MVIFYILLVFMIVAAIIAIETKDLLSSVVSVGAIGFFSSLIFLLLQAPDIAIAQVVVEVLSLIILIRATIARDLTTVTEGREFFATVVCVAILLAIMLVVTKAVDTLPPFGRPAFDTKIASASSTYITKGLKDTGAANIVAAVILDYRAYDTLGEATVLFASIIGAIAILRSRTLKSLQEPEP